MYIFRTAENEESEFFYLPSQERWYMAVDADEKKSYILVICGGQEYHLLTSDDLVRDYPGLRCWNVFDYLNAVLHAAFQEVRDGHECIDLDALQERLLPEFLSRWREEGYIEANE